MSHFFAFDFLFSFGFHYMLAKFHSNSMNLQLNDPVFLLREISTNVWKLNLMPSIGNHMYPCISFALSWLTTDLRYWEHLRNFFSICVALHYPVPIAMSWTVRVFVMPKFYLHITSKMSYAFQWRAERFLSGRYSGRNLPTRHKSPNIADKW